MDHANMRQRTDESSKRAWIKVLALSMSMMGLIACSTNSRVIEVDAPPTNVSPEIPSRFTRSVTPPFGASPQLASSERAWQFWYNGGAYYYSGVELLSESNRATADVFPESEYSVE